MSWITKEELNSALKIAEPMFLEWLLNPEREQDEWQEITIDGKVFDLNLWDSDDGLSSYCSIYQVTTNEKGYRETVTNRSRRLITLERGDYA